MDILTREPQKFGKIINASSIMISENPSNRDRSRHPDVKVHFLRHVVRDGHISLLNCAGTQNVSDAPSLKAYLDRLLRNIRNTWLLPEYLSQLFILVL